MVNGSLEEWLHPNENADEAREESRSLSLLQRLSIAIDGAYALDYLHHDCLEPIVRCDLKPSNILLDDEMIGHVGDFGLARFLLEHSNNPSANQSSSVGIRGSVGYMAPEYGMGNEMSMSADCLVMASCYWRCLPGRDLLIACLPVVDSPQFREGSEHS